MSNLHEKTTYEMKLQNCLWNFGQKSESEFKLSNPPVTNHRILSSFTILNFHKFWHCNQERVVLLDLQSKTYSCLHLFWFQKVRFGNVRQADILNQFLVCIFHNEFFHKIGNEFFLEQSFLIWFLSPTPFGLQIHWKCLCKMDLSSLITWKVFSVTISELLQLLHANVRLDVFLL